MKAVANFVGRKISRSLETVAIDLMDKNPKPSWDGEITDENVAIAMEFLEAFPIGSIFEVEALDDYLEEKGHLLQPVPKSKKYKKMAVLGTRIQFKKQANAGAKSEQWPLHDRQFQIVVHKHGKRWRVIKMSEAIVLERTNLKEKPHTWKENKIKAIRKLLVAVNPAVLDVLERYQLMRALTTISEDEATPAQKQLPFSNSDLNNEWVLED